MVRQLFEKSDRIGQQQLLFVRQNELPRRRIQGGKKLVRRVDLRVRHLIEQRRFSPRSCSRRTSKSASADAAAPRVGCRVAGALRRARGRAAQSGPSRAGGRPRAASRPVPRMPIPPLCRDKCVHIPVRRGSRYCNCASSICSLPSFDFARCAKMSRINCVRSMIFRSKTFSRLRLCAGLSSSVENHRSDISFLAKLRQFRGLARADIISRRRRGPALNCRFHHLASGAFHQFAQLLQRLRVIPFAVVRPAPGQPKGCARFPAEARSGATLSKQGGNDRGEGTDGR